MKLRNEKSIAIIYDAVSISNGLDVVTGSLKQNYYAESATYVPDRFVFPLVLRPRIEIADPNKSISDGDKVDELARLEWFLDGVKINSNDEFKIEGVTLKVFKNSEEPFVISYRAEWLDPRKKQIIVIEDSLVVSCISLAQNDADATMSLSKPQNWVHNPLKGERVYTINAYVSKGKVYQSAVEWYYVNKEGKDVLIDDTCDFYVDGQFTNALNVDSSYMENVVIKAKNISNDKLKEIYWFFDKHGNPVTHKAPEKTEVKGANVFSLPESPITSKLDYRIEGLTLEQLVKNGDFKNGVSGWTGTVIESDGGLLVSSSNDESTRCSIHAVSVGDYYYFANEILILEDNTDVTMHLNSGVIKNSGIFNKGSARVSGYGSFDRPVYAIVYCNKPSSGSYILKNSAVINLTQTFGAGNEPSKEWCDEHIQGYFEGTKSMQTPLRIKSYVEGRNLIIMSRVSKNKYLNSLGEILDATLFSITDYIKVTPNTSYIHSYSNNYGIEPCVCFYDSNKQFISSLAGSKRKSFKTPSNAMYLRTCLSNASINEEKLERGTKPTDWTPAPEDYLPATGSAFYIKSLYQLKSIGTTKDYIESGRLYKYISDDGQILDQPEIINLKTEGSVVSHPNGHISIDPAVKIEDTYNDGLQVDLPIKTLESIKVGTEYLDVSKAVVKENLITHPDIENGDFVSVEYIYDDNPIYGDNSISYLSLEEILDDLWLDNVYTYKVIDGKWELVKITEISDYEEWLKAEKTSPYTLAPDGVVFGKYQAETKFIRQYPSSLYVDFIAPTRLKEGVSQIKARALVGTRDGVLENPSKYFTIKWYKRSTGAGQVDLPIGEGNEIIIDVADKDMIGIEIESIKTK